MTNDDIIENKKKKPQQKLFALEFVQPQHWFYIGKSFSGLE